MQRSVEELGLMKITDVNVEVYRWERHTPIRNGMYTYPTSGLNVVKIDTDEGVTGYGYYGGIQGSEEVGVSGPDDRRVGRVAKSVRFERQDVSEVNISALVRVHHAK